MNALDLHLVNYELVIITINNLVTHLNHKFKPRFPSLYDFSYFHNHISVHSIYLCLVLVFDLFFFFFPSLLFLTLLFFNQATLQSFPDNNANWGKKKNSKLVNRKSITEVLEVDLGFLGQTSNAVLLSHGSEILTD